MKNRKAIVLLSGGLDSAVALAWAKKQGYECRALSFHYGQRHNRELKSARRLARMAHVPHLIVHFNLPWSRSSLTSRRSAIPHHRLDRIGKTQIPSTYVPGRNTLFLSFALSLADQDLADTIVIGANSLDYSGYPDCRPRFLKAFEKVATWGSRLGMEEKKRVRVLAPLLKMNKAEIVRLGHRLKVPMHITWSCYEGGRHPCGRCDSCQLRAKGFKEAGIMDD